MTQPSEKHLLDPELSTSLSAFFDRIPFNQLLGMEVIHVSREHVEVRMAMKPEMIGNFIHQTLHGGVIASILDVAGGLQAVIGAYERTREMPEQERRAVLSRVGTIDLRVDYLQPGRGQWFLARARLMRAGRKVAVTRMELHNDREALLAVGTGTYLCG